MLALIFILILDAAGVFVNQLLGHFNQNGDFVLDGVNAGIKLSQVAYGVNSKPASGKRFCFDLNSLVEGVYVKPSEANLRSEALEKLDILTGRIKGATQFRAINLIPGLSTTEKGMLARIFRNLMEHYPQEEAQKCIDMILSTYSET